MKEGCIVKILVTGFKPFGGESINPSCEVLKKLKNRINAAEVLKLEVPVVFGECIEIVIAEIQRRQPDYVLMLGQFGDRPDITVERISINISDAILPDEKGNLAIDEPIDNTGLPAYFSTLPIKKIVARIKGKGIPASISNTAGTYVCNNLMYGVLNYINKNDLPIKAGVIHLPFAFEQVVDKKGIPAMDLKTMIRAIEEAIKEIIDN